MLFCKVRHTYRHTYQTVASLVVINILQASMCAVQPCVVLSSHVMSLAPYSSLAIGVHRSQSLDAGRAKAECESTSSNIFESPPIPVHE